LGGTGSVNLLAYEKWMTQIIEKLGSTITQGTVLDIGVNLGQTLIKIKSYFSSNIQYIGFEPNPICVQYVQTLIRANDWNHVQLFPIALFNQTGILTLHSYDDNDTDASASVVANFRPNQTVKRVQHVPGYSFSDLATQIDAQNIRVVKIDVEGAESQIVQSLQALLHSNNIVLLMEILPAYTNDNIERIERQNTISKILTDTNMQLYRIVRENDALVGLAPLKDNYINVHSDINQADYIAFKKSNTQDLASFKIII
jgi:FkbM family methyltransferase